MSVFGRNELEGPANSLRSLLFLLALLSAPAAAKDSPLALSLSAASYEDCVVKLARVLAVTGQAQTGGNTLSSSSDLETFCRRLFPLVKTAGTEKATNPKVSTASQPSRETEENMAPTNGTASLGSNQGSTITLERTGPEGQPEQAKDSSEETESRKISAAGFEAAQKLPKAGSSAKRYSFGQESPASPGRGMASASPSEPESRRTDAFLESNPAWTGDGLPAKDMVIGLNTTPEFQTSTGPGPSARKDDKINGGPMGGGVIARPPGKGMKEDAARRELAEMQAMLLERNGTGMNQPQPSVTRDETVTLFQRISSRYRARAPMLHVRARR